MQLAPIKSATFVNVSALPAKAGEAPQKEYLSYKEEPVDAERLVTVRYHGTTGEGKASRQSHKNMPEFASELWYGVKGSFDDAVRAARDLAVAEGFVDDGSATFARSSVAVLEAGKGAWHLQRMAFTEGMGDGMDAIISMPIDVVPASKSEVSVPYGAWAKSFDAPSKVMVRFDDDRVAALVGVDSIALAPGR